MNIMDVDFVGSPATSDKSSENGMKRKVGRVRCFKDYGFIGFIGFIRPEFRV